MAGAWELPPPGVLVAILTRGTVSTQWGISFRNLRLPPASDIGFYSGMPYDHARNTACQQALERGFSWLFFADDDVCMPADTIERLISHGLDIVSGLYYRRNEPIMPVMLKEGNPKPSFIIDFTPGQLVEADLVGAGCLLIHTRVLRAMKKPWFEWLLDREDIPEGARCSEDFAFARKAKSLGFKIFVDTAIQCEHIGYGRSLVGGRFAPAEL
jgi:hypothetical protein